MIRGVAAGISLFAYDSARGFIGTFIRFRPARRPLHRKAGIVAGYCRLQAANQNPGMAGRRDGVLS